MTSPRLLALLATPALLFAGCEGVECDAMAVASVNLTVLAADGGAIDADGLVVQYTVDGGDLQDCEPMTDDGFVCGWEQSGEFAIFAEAPGYEPGEAAVTVEADECHPIGEVLEIRLDPITAFEEPRAYEHVLYTGQDCDDAMAAGMNCAQWVSFCPDGSAEIVLTDIINPGTYELDLDGLDASFPGGDAPPAMRFDWDGDDLVDEATNNVWTETDAPPCN